MPDQPVPSPEELREKPCPSERRAWVRSPCNRDVSCHPRKARSGVFWPAKVQDVSASGIGLLLDRRVDTGSLLDLTFEIDPETTSMTLLVRVIHVTLVTAHPGLRWLAGCAFTRELSDAELRTLLS
ncbi:MAG TPA: PilZ domain-containing protein [Gemmataceae bacterium]|jgi:hypothetical protein|nr:PilZ domain-containing protein [Gemmataceae bacterium]